MAGKVPQDWLWEWEMVPGIGGGFDALGVIQEIKSSCDCRGFGRCIFCFMSGKYRILLRSRDIATIAYSVNSASSPSKTFKLYFRDFPSKARNREALY